MFRELGLEAYLIGSVEKNGRSFNDVDILLIDPPKKWRGILVRLLRANKRAEKNDWEGAVFRIKYGKVDIFIKNSGRG